MHRTTRNMMWIAVGGASLLALLLPLFAGAQTSTTSQFPTPITTAGTAPLFGPMSGGTFSATAGAATSVPSNGIGALPTSAGATPGPLNLSPSLFTPGPQPTFPLGGGVVLTPLTMTPLALTPGEAPSTPTIAALPTMAPPTTATISIDSPSDGASISNGRAVLVGGWAVDPASPIEDIDVLLDGPPGQGTFVGAAENTPRDDVAQIFSQPAWSNSGYVFSWTPQGIPPGDHQLYIVATAASGKVTVASVKIKIGGSGSGAATAGG